MTIAPENRVTTSDTEYRLRGTAVAAAITAAGIGVVHLAAWFSGAMTYRGFSQITMKTNAALCLFLSASALIIVTLRPKSPVPRIVARIIATMAMIIGLLTSLEHLFGFDFGIDQLLAREPPGALGILHPNRMGPPGAITYAIGGVALLLLLDKGRKRVTAGQVLGLVISLVALTGMLGYLYGVEGLYGATRYTVIAWPTTVGNFLLGIGLLCSRAHEGFIAPATALDPGGTAIRRLLPGAVLIPVLLGWLRLVGERHGLYEAAFGTTALVVSWIIIFSFLVFKTGVWTNRSAAGEMVAVEALQRTQILLLEAEKLSHTGAWEWDLTTDTWTFSDEWMRIHGTQQRNLTPEELLAIAHPDDRSAIGAAFEALRTGTRTYDIEHRIVRQHSGEVRTVRARGQYVTDPTGAVVRVYGFVQDITEQKEAEQALKRSEERFRSFVEASAQVIWTTNERGEVNLDIPAWQAYTGQTADEARGFGWMNAIAPEDRDRVAKAWSRAFASKGVYEVEYRLRLHDGSWRHILARGVPIFDQEGRVREYLGTCIDITERNQAEEALQESEARFRAVFEQSAVGMGLVSFTDARWIDVNSAFCSMLGYSAEEMRATPWPQITHPDDVDLDLIPFRRMAAGELDSYTVEKRFFHNLGHTIWARLTLSLVRDSAGAPDYEVAIIEDISERKRAEQALKEREEQLHLFIRHAPAALAMFDREMRYLSVSRRWVEMYTLGERELLGHSHYAIFPDIPEIWKEYHRRGLAGEVLRADADPFHRFDGSVQWLRWEIRPWYDFFGTVGGIVIFTEDITEAKRAEEELRRTVEELERSNRELQQFAYISSHDLQEPLRTVANYVQLLQKRYQGNLDERADKYISYIVVAASRMSTLIRDVLAFSRVGTEERAFAPVSLDTALGRALENLKMSISESSAVITHDHLPTVDGDEAQLMQLFQNLVGNALKYRRKEAAPRIHVSATREEMHWLFGIHDNGIGVDPEFYDRIFRIFQRLHQREAYPGTGIGLAICRKIVERHGGRLWVTSEPGVGSSFYFTLPARKETHAEP